MEDVITKIATIIKANDDVDMFFMFELWETLKPNGTEKERRAFFDAAGF